MKHEDPLEVVDPAFWSQFLQTLEGASLDFEKTLSSEIKRVSAKKGGVKQKATSQALVAAKALLAEKNNLSKLSQGTEQYRQQVLKACQDALRFQEKSVQDVTAKKSVAAILAAWDAEQVLARRHISLSTEGVITDQDDPDMQFYMQELFKLYQTNPTIIQQFTIPKGGDAKASAVRHISCLFVSFEVVGCLIQMAAGDW